VPSGAFRSLGKAQVTWGYESNLDSIARQMGIDPMQFRLKNFMRRGDLIVDGATPMDADYDVLLRRAAEAIGWDGSADRVGPRLTDPAGNGRVRGRGLSTTFRHGYSGGDNSFATVTLDPKGRLRIDHGGVEIGMGIYTVLARVAAQALGTDVEQIEVAHPTTDGPFTDGVASSRDTVCLGIAVENACEDLKRELLQTAVQGKGGEPEDWRVLNGRVWRGEESYSLAEILVSVSPTGTMMGKGVHRTPRRDNAFEGVVPHWETSAGAAEVEVDMESGEVRLLKYVTVCDVGKAIEPAACVAQLEGGAIMGLGSAMHEEMIYADEQLQNGDAFQYRLPLMQDMPEELLSVMVENGDGPGPGGAKGMGQTAVSPIAPAVGNAIFEATGARIHDLPITPEKVLRALGKL
jgi:CO/xanthine dehydrogenase Mo-binding subunit